MTVRVVSTTLASLFCVLVATQPSRGELIEAMAQDFCERNQWPCPYNCWDREATRAFFPPMVQNAWRRQNLLADYHFSVTSSELTAAGQGKVRWILTEAPLDHRTVFVRRGLTAEETQARMNAVRKYASKLALDSPPSIVDSNATAPGYSPVWPGAKDPAVSRRFQAWVPDKIYIPEKAASK